MTLAEWAKVPTPIWIMIGVLTVGMMILAVKLAQLSRREQRLFLSVQAIDNDLATAEDTIKQHTEVVADHTKRLNKVEADAALITRQPIKPPVPEPDSSPFTNPIARQGKHRAIPLPYGPKVIREG